MYRLVCVDDFEKEALQQLGKNTQEFFSSAADDELTLKENVKSFSRILIRPRMLRDVSNRDLSTTILGKKVDVPLGVAPSAFQRLAHADGECGSAQAVQKIGGIMVVSMDTTSTYEEIAAAAPKVRKWCQFYMYKDRSLTEALINRAENGGCEAMVFTLDCQYIGNRRVSLREPIRFPPHLSLPNYVLPDAKPGSIDLFKTFCNVFDTGVTWEAVTWLKSISKLPLVVKGIQTPHDAVTAIEHGADAIWVSNHGGRQIDTVPTSIDILPEIVRAVGGRAEVYVDGGIRRGSDIFKALALGANMAFVGRPPIWGLAVDGARGATKVLEILRDELDLTMALSGVDSIKNITPDHVISQEKLGTSHL